MKNLDFRKVLEEFSDLPITYANKSEVLKHTTYMLNKAGSHFFVRVFDNTDEALPPITVQTFISDLPSGLEKNEEVLAMICNSVNYWMDNGTTTSYIKDVKTGGFFLTIKLGIPFINDVFKNVSDDYKGEHTLQMFLYTAFIEITKTRGRLSQIILEKDSNNENA